jgi:hypothetical protein
VDACARRGQLLLHVGRLNVAEPEAAVTAIIQRLRLWRGPALLDVQVRVHDRTAYLSLAAPRNTVPTQTTVTRKTGKKVRVLKVARPQRAINKEYADLVTGFPRDVVHQAFRPVPGLERVAISLVRPMVHPTLGHAYQGCVLSVLVDRATWERIIHGNVSAENAFRNFDLRFRPSRDFELQEVTPIRYPGGSAAADKAVQPAPSISKRSIPSRSSAAA